MPPSFSLPIWRRICLAILLLGAVRVFALQFPDHYPLEEWLFWRYLRYWLWCGVFSLGCLGTGETIVRALVGRLRGLHFHLITSLCVGVFTFGLLMFGLGLLGLYGPTLFWALPLGLVVAGLPRLRALWGQLLPRLRRRSPGRLSGLLPWLIVLFGAYGFLLVYTGVLTPENAMFDSRWKHMALAETYAAHGGVMRFDQGWLFSTRPHFASILYTWGFLIPGGELFDRIELCAHLEFTLFAWTTLLGIPALVRWLVPGADPKLVWAARFLFPGVFLYDSNLSVGADHVAATFAIPIVLLSHDVIRRRFELGRCVLLGMMLAAIVLVKETAGLMLLPVPVIMVAICMIRQAMAPRPGDRRLAWLWGPLLISVAAIAFSSPMWLTNLVWHGDPLYPNLHTVFTPRPWAADAAYMFDWGYKDFQFAGWSPGEDGRLLETIKVLGTWSFIPHDWAAFHGKRPVIGSLVTLLMPALLLLRGTRRTWVIALWIHAGLVVWFNLLPQDRYLQAMMPVMSGFVAAVLVLAWRQRVRVTLALLVATQLVWGGDVYFIHRNQLKRVVALFAAGDKGEYDKRLRTQGAWHDIGKTLPSDARMLVHEVHPHLGSGVVTIPDFQTWQFGLSYGLMQSPRDVWEAFRAQGITHVFWRSTRSRSWDSLAGDILFFSFVRRHTLDVERFGKAFVGKMPDEPPPGADEFEDTVAVVGCRRRGLPSGLYRVTDLNIPMFGPRKTEYPEPRVPATTEQPAESLVAQASFVVVDPSCMSKVKSTLRKSFEQYAKRDRRGRLRNRGYQIWSRKATAPETATKPVRKDAEDARSRAKRIKERGLEPDDGPEDEDEQPVDGPEDENEQPEDEVADDEAVDDETADDER